MKNFTLITLFTFILSISTLSKAITIIAPGAAALTEGDEYNVYPFALYPDGYYQQLYDASLFNGQSGIVDKISFRLDENASGSTFNAAYNMEVRLSNTLITPNNMSTTFDENVGIDEAIVFSDYIQFSASYTSNLNPFDVTIDVNNIFSYNGSANLLLQIQFSRDTGCTGCSTAWLDAVSSSFDGGNLMQRLWSNNLDATNGYTLEPRGLVTSFEIKPVPIPATIWLFGTGIISLSYFTRRIKYSK